MKNFLEKFIKAKGEIAQIKVNEAFNVGCNEVKSRVRTATAKHKGYEEFNSLNDPHDYTDNNNCDYSYDDPKQQDKTQINDYNQYYNSKQDNNTNNNNQNLNKSNNNFKLQKSSFTTLLNPKNAISSFSLSVKKKNKHNRRNSNTINNTSTFESSSVETYGKMHEGY